MSLCLLCGAPRCNELVNFGAQPVSHHFWDGAHKETTHPIDFAQCASCGLAQLINPIPPEKLTPHFDWISYNEPEAHLDAMVDALRSLPGITPDSSICGLSYKEDSTRKRLAKLGFAKTFRIDERDLGITKTSAGMEMVQDRVRPAIVDSLREKYGSPDIVIARHILEHSHRPVEFMGALAKFVRPGGYVVFEVPDCARGFDLLDYTTLWEDHTMYLVESTLLMTVKAGGFSIARFEEYRAPYENCLVVFAQPSGKVEKASLPPESFEREKIRAENFAKGWPRRQAEMRGLLTKWKQRGGIALFGAGHQAAMFLNLLGVADLIDCVLDDHPQKRGLQMPGTRLPIVGSGILAEGKIKLCLSSLGVDSEVKVIHKHAYFTTGGGTFASIFPVKPGAILNHLAGPPVEP
jgi:hypothetical protein